MAKCHLKINVYHSSDYISFLIFVYGVYNLFTNFGNMSQKTKCQNCVKQRNPAETKDSGCQKTHKIHTCPDRYFIGRKKTVDPIDGNLSQYCPNAEIHDHLSFMFHKNHKKHCTQDPAIVKNPIPLSILSPSFPSIYMNLTENYSAFSYIFSF